MTPVQQPVNNKQNFTFSFYNHQYYNFFASEKTELRTEFLLTLRRRGTHSSLTAFAAFKNVGEQATTKTTMAATNTVHKQLLHFETGGQEANVGLRDLNGESTDNHVWNKIMQSALVLF